LVLTNELPKVKVLNFTVLYTTEAWRIRRTSKLSLILATVILLCFLINVCIYCQSEHNS